MKIKKLDTITASWIKAEEIEALIKSDEKVVLLVFNMDSLPENVNEEYEDEATFIGTENDDGEISWKVVIDRDDNFDYYDYSATASFSSMKEDEETGTIVMDLKNFGKSEMSKRRKKFSFPKLRKPKSKKTPSRRKEEKKCGLIFKRKKKKDVQPTKAEEAIIEPDPSEVKVEDAG